jgi:hypothetical protein
MLLDNPSDDLPLTAGEVDHLMMLADGHGHEDPKVAQAALILIRRFEGMSYRAIGKEVARSPKFCRSVCLEFRDRGRTACPSLRPGRTGRRTRTPVVAP